MPSPINMRTRFKDVSASASNETMDGGEEIKALPGFGPARLTKLFVHTEATADVHRITLSSPSMTGGIMPIDFPVMQVAGGEDGEYCIDLGPGQYLPENAVVDVGAYNADAGNACFTVVSAEINYQNPNVGGQIACYRVAATADVTARTWSTTTDVLAGKLVPEKSYHILGISYHDEQADSVVVMAARLSCSSFLGKKPGIGAGKILPEHASFHYWHNGDDISRCPVIKGSDQVDIEFLANAATKPVAYILLWTK
jgi:hypothetical protein